MIALDFPEGTIKIFIAIKFDHTRTWRLPCCWLYKFQKYVNVLSRTMLVGMIARTTGPWCAPKDHEWWMTGTNSKLLSNYWIDRSLLPISLFSFCAFWLTKCMYIHEFINYIIYNIHTNDSSSSSMNIQKLQWMQ